MSETIPSDREPIQIVEIGGRTFLITGKAQGKFNYFTWCEDYYTGEQIPRARVRGQSKESAVKAAVSALERFVGLDNPGQYMP